MTVLLALVCGLAIGILIGLLLERSRNRKLQNDIAEARQEVVHLRTLVQTAKEQNEREAYLMKRLEEEQRMREEQMKIEFQNLANEILDVKSASLKNSNKEQLDSILTPLKENIEKLGKTVIDTRIAGVQQKESIEHAIRNLVERTDKIGEDAINLTKALKANPKVQGDWGEMILERMLEESGLRKGEEYFVQENCITEDGRNLRPDVIVRFPEKRCIIIDSKVSLTAYVNYMNASTVPEQNQALAQHLTSVRDHINELAAKDYSKVVKDSIGYVLMFIPNEGSYIAALEKDKELLNYAYKKRIIVISPSNLMMALQLAYNLWQSEKQTRNVEEIIRRGNLLYEKFVTFLKVFEKLGKQLDDTRKDYDTAFGTLARGNGNIIVSLNKLKELGLTPKKDIPESVIDKTESLPGI